MKFAAFNRMPYRGADLPRGGRWPLPGAYFGATAATRSMRDAIEQFEAADALGFDWVTCGEHHYGQIMSPSGTILAGGYDSLSTGVGRAHILPNAFPNASGIKPPRSPGCGPTAGWRST